MCAAAATSSSPAHGSFTGPSTRAAFQDPFSGDTATDYVLHFGFQDDRRACKRQDDALFALQRKIVQREDAAHALLVSANVLAMSVMASQLTMYRWKVSEAQTVNAATGMLQEMVSSATRCGYQVRRERPKPLKLSKYADGEGLKRLYEKNMAKLERRRMRREMTSAASTTTAAADKEADADALYNTLLKSSGSSDDDDEEDGKAASGAVDAADGTARHRNGHRHQHSRHASHSSDDSMCSADLAGPSDGKRKLPPAPPDAIPRLVLVDRFTHESFADIAQSIRFFDERDGLQLVLVLLLSGDGDTTTVQGAGTVVTPQHDISVEDAYAAGYDLVLRHHFDHTVVNFLSDLFVSSAGRWRGDIRAKAAVGNYLSLKNVLLGRIDTEALQQMVWKENVDDAELLQQLGDHTLALHSEAKHYGIAGHKLSSQVAGDVNVLSLANPEEVVLEEALTGTKVLGTLPHLRAGQTSLNTGRGGVRSATQRAFLPLEGLTITSDELQQRMDPSDRVQHSVRQRRQTSGERDSEQYDYHLVDEQDENRALLMTAIEEEMSRLVADNDQKSAALRHLQEDVTRLQRTVEVLRRQRKSGGGGGEADGRGSVDGGGGSFDLGAPGRRPDSGSLVNLTKEQQIYILKERLDQANDQITALLDGTGRARPNSGNRNHSRGGGTSSRGSGHRGASQRRLATHEQARLQAYQRYHEHREAELLSLQDEDALWKSGQADELTAALMALRVGDGTAGSPNSARRVSDPVEVAAQRREREATHRVVQQLQEELTQMHALAGAKTPNQSARLIFRMEEAMKRLEAQNARIAQLQELRRMDEAFFQAELKRVGKSAEGLSRAGEAATTGTGKKKKTKGKTTSTSAPPPAHVSSAPRKRAASEADDDNEAGSDDGGGAPGRARPPAGKKKAVGTGSAPSAALRATLEAEYTAKLDALSAQFAREQRARESALRAHLEKLYQHIRRPHTESYAKLLESQRVFSERHAKDTRHRLDFALTHLKPHQLVAEDGDGAGRGVLSRVSDPVAREKLESLAVEYAQHAAHAAEAQRRLEALRPALAQDDVRDRLQQLSAQREDAREAVAQAAAAPGGSLDTYLAAVEALEAIDRELAMWVDVDVSGALRDYASAAQGASAVGAAHPPIVAAPAVIADSRTSPSAPEPGSPRTLRIAVSDAELRDVAEAYCAIVTDSHSTGQRSPADASRRKPLQGGSRGASAGSPHAPRQPAARRPDSGTVADSETGAGEPVSSSGASPRYEREVPQALVEALAGHGEDIVEALQAGVDAGVLSQTQQLWYGLMRDRYARGYIHPDRMKDLDKVALSTDAPAVSSSAVDGEAGEDESETARAKRLFLTAHRDLQRLLLVLTVHFPALMPVVAVCTPRVEAGLAAELLPSANPQATACVTPSFMAAADAARVSWVVEYVCLVLSDVHERAAAASPQTAHQSTNESDEALEVLRAVRSQQVLFHSHPQDPLVVAHLEGCRAVAAQYEEGEGGWWASPTRVPGSQALGSQGPHADDEAARVQAYLEAKRAELGVDPEDLGYTADDLAALFSRKVKDQQELADLLPADLYESLDESDDPAYVEMMRGIRGELEYLNELKQQRMEELVLQYRLRQRANPEAAINTYAGRAPPTADGDPYAGRAVPEFEVKEGTPGWYGMEAARRVKDILRRKRKPDQIVLDGGPGGGNVGVELSRRTAFPAPPPRDVAVSQSAQSRLRAARTAALPPLRHNGMSRQQQQRQRLAEGGYSPRDITNYNAYQSVLAHTEFDGMPYYQPLETPAEMTRRLMQYRASISRAASRLGGGVRVGVGDAWIAQELGAPYYLPIAASEGRSPGTGTPRATGVAGAAPTLTTWTYGLPSEQLELLLQNPVEADGGNVTTTVVLPHESRSRVAEQALSTNPQRSTTGASARRPTATFTDNTAGGGAGFVGGVSAYASPAALAAQRLSTMMRLSMADPAVASLMRPPRTSLAAAEGPLTAATASPPAAAGPTQYADLSQTRRASRYLAHRRESASPREASPRQSQSGPTLSPSPPPQPQRGLSPTPPARPLPPQS